MSAKKLSKKIKKYQKDYQSKYNYPTSIQYKVDCAWEALKEMDAQDKLEWMTNNDINSSRARICFYTAFNKCKQNPKQIVKRLEIIMLSQP